MHSKIANSLSKRTITKTNFRDKLEYILKYYYYKTNQILHRDYITRTCIIMIEKYKINDNTNPIGYDCFFKRIKKNSSDNDK